MRKASQRRPKPMGPVERARHALARRTLEPMRRYQALANEMRRRDLSGDEIALLCQAAEDARRVAHALRKGACHGV